MIALLSRFSPSGVKAFYGILSLLLLSAASTNFVQTNFVHATANDQCAWIKQRNDDSIAVIDKIVPGGVADLAGLHNGDTLVKINGHHFDYETSQSLINAVPAGGTAVYTIRRGANEQDVPVRILRVYNLFNISLFVTAILFLAVGSLTVFVKPKGVLQQRFMNYCLANAFVFTLGTGIHYTLYPGTAVLNWCLRIVLVVCISIALPQQVLFFSHFPRRNAKADKRWFAPLMYGIAISAVVGNAIITDFVNKVSSPWNIVLAIMAGWMALSLFSFYPAGLGRLTQRYFSGLSKEDKKAIRPIIFAFFISISSLIFFTISVQSVPFALFLRPELSLPLVLFASTPIAIAYSIIRYGLMDVGIIIERSLIFAIATAVLAILYFSLVSMLSSVLGNYMSVAFGLNSERGTSLWVTVSAFVVLGLAFDPVKRRTEDWVARIFYQERINYQKALLELSRELPGLISTQAIVDTLSSRLQITIHPERVAVVLTSGDTSPAANEAQGSSAASAALHSLLQYVRESGTVVSIGLHENDHISDELRSTLTNDEHIELAVPMMFKQDAVGMIAVGKKRSGKVFSRDDIDLLQTVASQAAIAFENARLHETEIQKQKMEDSLAIARRIQQSLLPQVWPSLPGLDVCGISQPAEIVGGDFYDLIELSPSKLLCVIGDVSGKGISAALYMSKIQGMMQLASRRYDSPREIMIYLNDHVFGAMERNAYVTMALALFDLEAKAVHLCRCGHTKPLVVIDGRVEIVETTGLGLGLCTGELFARHLQESTLPLEPGLSVVLYSDGLNEALNNKREEYGEERIRTCLSRHAGERAVQLRDALLLDVEHYRQQTDLSDDLTMVVAHYS